MAGRGGKEAGKDDRHITGLVFGVTEQRVPVLLDGNGPDLQGARFLDGAGVITTETKHVPGKVLVGVDDQVHEIEKERTLRDRLLICRKMLDAKRGGESHLPSARFVGRFLLERQLVLIDCFSINFWRIPKQVRYL